jgi:UDP-N-acetylmuramate dehydrogenase
MEATQKLYQEFQGEGIPCLQEEPMSRHTTFRIGGPARLFVMPRDPDEARRVLTACRSAGVPVFVLGKGSNLLVGDGGIPGAVLSMEGLADIQVQGNCIRAQGGASLMAVCRAAQEAGLTGLEFAYGIPGQVGGGVYMNAGAYGGELRDVVESVEYLDEKGEVRTRSGAELEFDYRHSFFTGKGCVILSALFRLAPGNSETIAAGMEEIYRRRREKQPLEWPSAGSTFKRPQGAYAAALIQECGLKGFRVGGAQVSEKHAGFVINTGGATCADVLELIRQVQETVKEKTGFQLEPEVRVTGE